jgi:hypothetical protein
VGVAGSNPVVRSRESAGQGRCQPALLHVRSRPNCQGSRLVHDFVADGSVHGREAEFDVTMWVSRRALRLLATEHPSRPMNPPPSRGLCSGTDRGREERWGSRSAGNGAGPFADGLISRCPGTGRRMGRRVGHPAETSGCGLRGNRRRARRRGGADPVVGIHAGQRHGIEGAKADARRSNVKVRPSRDRRLFR